MRWVTQRLVLAAFAVLAIAGCQTGEAAEDGGPTLLTTVASRGDLSIRAEATGSVEPVRRVEVKSKASGEILRLFADVGDEVERGTLLAEVDPRDVANRFDQMEADLEVAQARLEISAAQLDRATQLLEAEVITQQEYENATLDYANSQASLVRALTNFELAELQLADVSIRAPMSGTIIQKNVEEGTVIQSASSNVSGGTALFVMADLGEMQARTLVDETDMGELRSGMQTAVRVEAFPDRIFEGVVEKIEPQATEVQNVTMFPVIVTLDNRAGLLKPGMNAEVEIFIDEALDVILVPNNAIVQTADVGPAAMALGLDVEELDLTSFMATAARGGQRGDRGGAAGGRRQGGSRAGGASEPQGGRSAGGQRGDANVEASGDPSGAMDGIQALRAQVETGEISQDSMRAAMRALGGGGASGRRAFASEGDPTGAPPRLTRPAAVFVLGADSIPEPRLVQLGLGDWDHTQVVSGLDEGETLVIVGAAQLQAQQQEFLDRMRDRMGGNPFGGSSGGMGRGRGR